MSDSLSKDLETVDKQISDIQSLCGVLGIKTPAGVEFVRHSLANALLFDRKHEDYGPRNVSGFGTFGVIVRMNDKFERLKHIFGQGRKKRTMNESIKDSLRDIHNYSNIALMVDSGRWPNE